MKDYRVIDKGVKVLLSTKEKLEQLGWNILDDDLNIHFVYMRRKNDDNNYDMIIFNKEYKEIDLTSIISFSTTINELQLILDYIKERKNDL